MRKNRNWQTEHRNTVITSVSIPLELAAKLSLAAKEAGLSKSTFASYLIDAELRRRGLVGLGARLPARLK